MASLARRRTGALLAAVQTMSERHVIVFGYAGP
jgi:hypothetical protein